MFYFIVYWYPFEIVNLLQHLHVNVLGAKLGNKYDEGSKFKLFYNMPVFYETMIK